MTGSRKTSVANSTPRSWDDRVCRRANTSGCCSSGYFEGIDSERGIAWRAADSLAVRSFVRLALHDGAPDHSTLSRTRRLIDVETHRAVFTWVQQRLVEVGLLKGRTVAIDATTLEANAAKVTKMKDGRTHLAHKAEHAVDLETGAIVAITVQGADQGDTTTIVDTVTAAIEQVEAARAERDAPPPVEEIITDKGYHSNRIMVELDALGIRSYVAEPARGRRDWSKEPEAQAPVYGNRRRMRGPRGRRLMRQRGERIERAFAHLYDTGGMRRTHLRGYTNILKRVLIHAGAFNLGLLMRHLIGFGTPRGLQGRLAAVLSLLFLLIRVARPHGIAISACHRLTAVMRSRLTSPTLAVNSSVIATYATGC